MTLDTEKLTAYVLGELDDAERQAVEDALSQDAAARKTVAELRATADFAREALQTERSAGLAPQQLAAIREKAVNRPARRWALPLRVCLSPVPIMLLILVVLTASVVPGVIQRNRQRQLASNLTVAQGNVMLKRSAAPFAPASPPPAGQPAEGKPVPTSGTVAISQSNVANARQEYLALTDEKTALGSAGGGLQNQLHIRGNFSANNGLVFHDSSRPREETSKSSNDAEYMWSETHLNYGNSSQPSFVEERSKVYWLYHNTENYDRIVDNPFREVAHEPLSTFSIDVDTASYSNVRRFLTENTMPPPDSVRIEELLNYFDYDYAPPADKSTPFAAHVEVASCPWAPAHRLARIGLKGWEIATGQRPASNLVFLIDVSGSMQPENKLPLLKEALRMLVRQLDERDRIAIVVYASNSGLVLPSTPGNEQETILEAIGRLEAGGSTQGSAGIQLAYETAVQNFLPGATNRVILCTDGDFNVGITDQGQLTRLIEEKAKSRVFLTVIGVGMGNLKDSTLEKLADKGNGNYAYIDTLNEARKVLVMGLSGTLVTIAKDVKIQVEFNPAQVKAYRLIGYENRILAAQDFNDDTKDAGEIGAGHSVTALYEIVPPGAPTPGAPNVDPLKYQSLPQTGAAASSGDLFTLKLRYKAPDGDTSKLLEFPVRDGDETLAQATSDFRFASAVAEFGMILRGSPHKGNATYDSTLALAGDSVGKDPYGYRSEFLALVRKAKSLSPQPQSAAAPPDTAVSPSPQVRDKPPSE